MQREGYYTVGSELEDTSYADHYAPYLVAKEAPPAVFGGYLHVVVAEIERRTGAYISISDEPYTYES